MDNDHKRHSMQLPLSSSKKLDDRQKLQVLKKEFLKLREENNKYIDLCKKQQDELNELRDLYQFTSAIQPPSTRNSNNNNNNSSAASSSTTTHDPQDLEILVEQLKTDLDLERELADDYVRVIMRKQKRIKELKRQLKQLQQTHAMGASTITTDRVDSDNISSKGSSKTKEEKGVNNNASNDEDSDDEDFEEDAADAYEMNLVRLDMLLSETELLDVQKDDKIQKLLDEVDNLRLEVSSLKYQNEKLLREKMLLQEHNADLANQLEQTFAKKHGNRFS